MFTHTVRLTLARDYGIRDIPGELLEWFIHKERARYKADTLDAPTCAFFVACAWQRGLA